MNSQDRCFIITPIGDDSDPIRRHTSTETGVLQHNGTFRYAAHRQCQSGHISQL